MGFGDEGALDVDRRGLREEVGRSALGRGRLVGRGGGVETEGEVGDEGEIGVPLRCEGFGGVGGGGIFNLLTLAAVGPQEPRSCDTSRPCN